MILSAPATDFGPLWEIIKGVMLFVITGCASYMARKFMSMSDFVKDHETAIYGQHGANGLKRGLKGVTDRVDLIEDRNTAIDAVTAAERAQYLGPDRRHAALRTLADLVRQELKEEGK
jgi:hypothetical protein